jgi:2'-5' RNA ligase
MKETQHHMESKKIMIKLLDMLKEDKHTYDYGCVMLYYNFPLMNKIHDVIDPKDIYTEEGDRTFGLEDEPHTTLLFGLHEEVTEEDVQTVLNNFIFSTCKLYNASTFNNPQYDVLKFDVQGDNLHQANKELRKYPYTNGFPDYHPHTTIGYLKPTTGKKYTEMLKGQEFELTPTHAVYSTSNRNQIKLPIKVK